MKNAAVNNAEYVLENLTRTLLYEGYSLYPYYRSAIKNQKPIPFGVVFPKEYNEDNQHAHSIMQTGCIVEGIDAVINIRVRFLHLITIKIFQSENNTENFQPVYSLKINNNFYQCGWQTIERKIDAGTLPVAGLMKEKTIPFHFDKSEEEELIYDERKNTAGKKINFISAIEGTIMIQTVPLKDLDNTYKITVQILNNTPIESATSLKRDDILTQSFISTHTILNAENGKFISHQDPPEKYKQVINGCRNLHCYPILIEADDTTLLSSPIALYDYPQINPQSSGDLFDSTEIEEALLLHVGMLSEDEKNRISQTDEKLKTMLNKVNNITPQELMNFHSHLKQKEENQIVNQNNNV